MICVHRHARYDPGVKLRHWRIDLATDLPPPRVTAEGIVYTGRAARTGEHRYPWGIERRDAAELARVVEQLVGKPVILRHPPAGERLADDAPRAGRVLSARVDGEHALVEVLVTDMAVVLEVAGGVRELSLGYDVRVDAEGYHRDTVIDHLALVEQARCGASCAIRTDCAGPSACACGGGMLHQTATRGQAQMDPEEHKKIVAALEAERDIAVKRADKLEAERDAAVVRADAADAAVKARADAAVDPTLVAARVKLEREAGAILVTDGKPEDVSALSDHAIRVAVVKRADGIDVAAKSPTYVEARYDAVLERPNPLAGLAAVVASRVDARDVASLPDPEAARAKMQADTDNASKVK